MTPDFEQKARELAPCSETFCSSVNGLYVYHANLCAVHLRPAIAQALREMYEAGVRSVTVPARPVGRDARVVEYNVEIALRDMRDAVADILIENPSFFTKRLKAVLERRLTQATNALALNPTQGA